MPSGAPYGYRYIGKNEVEILSGQYTCHDAVHLHSCVRLVGSGEKTVLRNGQFGISIGHKDTDNTFIDCLLRDNGENALVFRGEIESNGAHRNTWRNCELSGSRIGIPGRAHVCDNLFENCRIGERCDCAAVLPAGTKRFTFTNCTWKSAVRNDAGHVGLP